MKHPEILPWILFGTAFVLAVIAAVVLVRMKKDDIIDGTDYQQSERPFIDKH